MRSVAPESTSANVDEVKVTLRLPKGAAATLAKRAEDAGLARGTYVATVLADMPAPPYPRDHAACLEALGLSTDGLAVIAKDLLRMLPLDGESDHDMMACAYRALEFKKAVDSHLHLSSQLVSDLRNEAQQRSRALQSARRTQEV